MHVEYSDVGSVTRVGKAIGRLGRRSVDILRVSLCPIFLGFGALKFFPGASPAEELVIRTVDTLTFGVITGSTALLLTAVPFPPARHRQELRQR